MSKSGEIEGRLNGGVSRGRKLEFSFDGRSCRAFEGENVAAALMAIGQRTLRSTARFGEPRGMYCGIGVCFDCVMTIDGRPNVRACRTPVREGMRVESQKGAGKWKVEDLTRRTEAEMRPTTLVELFTKGCPACGGWLEYGKRLAGAGKDYELRVWNVQEDQNAVERDERMARYGISDLPAIVIDGQILACCIDDGGDE